METGYWCSLRWIWLISCKGKIALVERWSDGAQGAEGASMLYSTKLSSFLFVLLGLALSHSACFSFGHGSGLLHVKIESVGGRSECYLPNCLVSKLNPYICEAGIPRICTEYLELKLTMTCSVPPDPLACTPTVTNGQHSGIPIRILFTLEIIRSPVYGQLQCLAYQSTPKAQLVQ